MILRWVTKENDCIETDKCLATLDTRIRQCRSIISSSPCNFDIVDIAMWTMLIQYRVNIAYIEVLSCLYRQHRDVNDLYTISCQYRFHRCIILFTSPTSWTSRYERCRHYPVYIDVHVLACLHCRHRDMNDVYTISCQHRLHRCAVLFTPSTSSTSRLMK